MLSARDTGLSILLLRISPDGRWLLCCMCDYGCFPVYRSSSDLYMIDLKDAAENGRYKYQLLNINSDQSESWHSWSSNTDAHYNLGAALANQGKLDEAIGRWLEVVRLDPNNVAALVSLATGYAKTDRLREALLSLEKALDIARSAGNQRLAQQITEQIELCKRNKPPNSPPHKSDGK